MFLPYSQLGWKIGRIKMYHVAVPLKVKLMLFKNHSLVTAHYWKYYGDPISDCWDIEYLVGRHYTIQLLGPHWHPFVFFFLCICPLHFFWAPSFTFFLGTRPFRSVFAPVLLVLLNMLALVLTVTKLCCTRAKFAEWMASISTTKYLFCQTPVV